MNLDKIHLHSKHLRIDELPENTLYIGAVGFEERSLGFLREIASQGKQLRSCVAIEYKPHNSSNRKNEFSDSALKVFAKLCWKTYDRFCPEDFATSLREIVELSKPVHRLVVDVSAMSKMLIVVLLHGLRNVDLPISIIYAPAETYHPLKENFEKAKAKTKDEFSDVSPYFLTTDVYTVVTTTTLSSIAMQGAPLAMVAYPNFNYLEIAALLNETTTQKLFLIESIKDPEQNAWRLEAIRWINRGLRTYVNPTSYEVDASDINANIELLENLYNEWHLTHKIALSPTGGKLQAVATFCLKIMHPDIHIIYPVVRQFAQEYTEGYLPHSELYFPSFSDFTKRLDQHRRSGLSEIEQILEGAVKKDSGRKTGECVRNA